MTGPDLRHRNVAFLKETAQVFFTALDNGLGGPPPHVPDGPPVVTSRLNLEAPRPDAGRHPYLTRFVENLIQSAREQDIPLFSMPTFTLSAGLAIIGNVTPQGLDKAIQQTNCIYLIVVVPDMGEFQTQLDVIDWVATNEHIKKRGGRIFFAAAATAETITSAISTIISANAPFILDGLTIVTFDKPELARDVASTMSRQAHQALMTLGTFYDGCLMLRNSEINLRHGTARLYRNTPAIEPDLPAWVIGSGPSLDSDLAFIRENQDKAVIISCGSALSALLAGGITPDFHVELENIDVGLTLEPARAYDLSGISLFAPASVDPVVLDTFGEIIFGFRQNLPNQPLYGLPASAIPLAGEPTVANLGLAFAREQGFPRICFFGIDMGTRDSARDHAAGTWHTDPESSYDGVDHPHKVPANFGGDCFTTTGLRQALHRLNLSVGMDRKNRDYINCSDGAAITGARPINAADLELDIPENPKTETVRSILNRFALTDFPTADAAWPGETMMNVIRSLLTDIRNDISAIEAFDRKDYLATIASRLRYFEGHIDPAPPGPKTAARMLVRGALGSLLLFMEYYLNRVTSPQHLTALGRAAQTIIDRELKALEQDAANWIGGAEIGAIPDFNDIRTPPDALFFDPPAVPRNAPCPCGSGKRFKQCHGQTR
ncbi:MAG: DUF115 domain-containing protein [Rhodospirillales bacterium]